MKQKSAQGHVEMIISFVMFVGAIMFIFMYINPISKNQETFSISDRVQKTIIENISSEIGKVYAVANEPNGCYDVSYFITSYGDNFREVLDKDNPKVYTIYFSPLLNHSAPNNLNSCPVGNYSLTSYSNERVIFYKYIQNLKLRYDDYSNLKKELRLVNDFSFSIYDTEGMRIEELSVDKNIPSGINVQSYELPIRVINKNADAKSYILKINAWE